MGWITGGRVQLAAFASAAALIAPIALAMQAEADQPVTDQIAVAPPQPSPGEAARATPPVYRDPPSYKGITKPPKSKAITLPRVTLTKAGVYPNSYVDEAGTAHIVWNEGRGDGADVAVYCRLKRAANSCQIKRELTWDKVYGAGDGPQYNVDNLGPKIIRVGEQLLVLSFRYPTIGVKPDGASSNTVVGWVSNNGGNTWSEAEILGRHRLGELTVVGPEDDPLVVNLGQDPFCEGTGSTCVTSFRSGIYDPSSASLNTTSGADYHQRLVERNGSLIAAMANSGVGSGGGPWSIWLRQWNGTEPVTNPANWTTSTAISGDEPALATGPDGVYLAQRRWLEAGFLGGIQVRQVTSGGGVPAAGTPTTVSGDRAWSPEIFADASGRLHLAWIEEFGLQRHLRYATRAADTADFTIGPDLATTGNPTSIELAMAADGGGFVLHKTDGGASSEGTLTAVGVGNPAPTGKKGMGDITGGGNIDCRQVKFGSFDVKTVDGCFLKGTGKNQGQVITRGAVTLNGLEIIPLPGSQLIIDGEKLTLDTIGEVRVLLRDTGAEIELFKGRLARDLSQVKPGTRLFEFPKSLFKVNVLGFPVSSAVPIELTKDGVRIPVELTLPAEFGGFTGKAVLLGQTGKGLVLDSLQVRIGPVPFGVLTVDKVAVDWERGGTWTGYGKLTMPVGGSIEADVGFETGDFAYADFNYSPNPPVTIGPFVYLTRVGGGFAIRPQTKITARASIGAGAPVQGLHPVVANGEASMLFPKSGPARFGLEGNVELFAVRISEAQFEFVTSGYATFKGGSSVHLGPVSGNVGMSGFVDGRNGRYGANFAAGLQVCGTAKDPDGELPDEHACGGAGADATVSSIGLAACAWIDPPVLPKFSAGLGTRWNDLSPAVLASPIVLTAEVVSSIKVPCSTAPYRVPPPLPRAVTQDLAPGGTAVAIPAGLPTATILVQSKDGVPDAVVKAPDGTTLVGPGASGDGVHLVGFDGADAVWVMIDKPTAGNYSVEPAAGSVAFSDIRVSHGFKPASVSGKVKLVTPKKPAKKPGKPAKPAKPAYAQISYSTKNLTSGQSIQFRETGKFGTRILGTTKKRSGTFTFTPRRDAARARTVYAVVQAEGLDQRTIRLGTYRAPARVKPAAVTKLKARKTGSKLQVTFVPPAGNARTEIQVRGSAGTRVKKTLGPKAKKFVLDGVRWDKKLTVTVVTITPDGRPGPARTVIVKPKRAK